MLENLINANKFKCQNWFYQQNIFPTFPFPFKALHKSMPAISSSYLQDYTHFPCPTIKQKKRFVCLHIPPTLSLLSRLKNVFFIVSILVVTTKYANFFYSPVINWKLTSDSLCATHIRYTKIEHFLLYARQQITNYTVRINIAEYLMCLKYFFFCYF